MTSEPRQSWTDVRDTIRDRILNRVYAPGDKLPRDEDIAAAFGCARTTVHRAMQDLAQIGLVERKRKGGTHVRTDPVTRATFDIPITRLEVEQRGGTYDYRLIRQAVAPTPPTVMATFALTAPVDMLHVQAVHLANARPYIYEDRWINLAVCGDIMDHDLSKHSANEWLVRNKPYSRLDLQFYAVNATGELATHLAAKKGAAVLVIERTTWTDAQPITTVQSATAPGYTLAAHN